MLGYCTNVYSGTCSDDIIETIHTQVSSVQTIVNFPIGIGLWLPNSATLDVDIIELKEALQQNDLSVFTFNGFPMNDFHADVVKHHVYKPTWTEEDRLSYTIRLATILSQLIESDSAGISTLPLGWDSDSFTNKDAAAMLNRCVDALEVLEFNSGKQIHIDIEAEPGCRLQTSFDIATFFQQEFGDDERIRRYLRVCHDTCHAAVMRETAESCVDNYRQAGIDIGKVQLSSAIVATSQSTPSDLQSIAEPRYLHQTTVMEDGELSFFEDLPDVPFDRVDGEFRIHFHVPIHLEHFGSLQTTQADLKASIPILREYGVTNWEVETYTWDVIPHAHKQDKLAQSIAKELQWAATELNI